MRDVGEPGTSRTFLPPGPAPACGRGGGPRKAFALTDEGAEQATRLAAESTPWEALVDEGDRSALELRDLVVSVVDAARQVVRVAEPGQATQAKEVLVEARRSLYGILAAEPTVDPGATPTADAAPTADAGTDDRGRAPEAGGGGEADGRPDDGSPGAAEPGDGAA